MVQFKPFFLGQRTPTQVEGEEERQLPRVSSLDDFKGSRICNSQRCIRVGGKHNDLDDVGRDGYHHTLFEMLGNWSFCNEYWKQESIQWGWDLLTRVYGLDPERIYVTYFQGNEEDGIPPDTETRDIWLQYLPSDRVLPFGSKENFWEMGNSGPCGPCTEIHYDRLGNRFVPELVNRDDPTVIELWNLVFMQYLRDEETRKLSSLPNRHVDTGMGLERLTSVLQNVQSNYNTDVFRKLFDEIEKLTNHSIKYQDRYGDEDEGQLDCSFRVISDHIRCLTVMIHDGVLPGNKGRNHMVRRILRRCVCFGKMKLRIQREGGWLHLLVPMVMESLGKEQGTKNEKERESESEMKPEKEKEKENDFLLNEEMKLDSDRTEFIIGVIKEEEGKFEGTWEKGRRRFLSHVKKLKPGDTIPGSLVWHMHETYGIYVDIVEVLSQELGLLVDRKGFEESLEEHNCNK